MKQTPGWAPAGTDTEVASAARVYDFYLGGQQNFPVDQEFGRRVIEVMPAAPEVARLNRAFLKRAVQHCAQRGIRQFLDIGSGIPTVGGAGNVHEFVQQVAPDCRVVYTDIEPVAIAHGRAILAENPSAAMTKGALEDPDGLLATPEVRRLLDFDQPVAILMLGVLHYIPEEGDPYMLVRRYRDTMSSGSYLVVSHGTDQHRPEPVKAMINLSRSSQNPAYMRSRDEIAGFMDGFDILDPGVVFLPDWRPTSTEDDPSELARTAAYGAVGRKP
jgi:hypothetical protein